MGGLRRWRGPRALRIAAISAWVWWSSRSSIASTTCGAVWRSSQAVSGTGRIPVVNGRCAPPCIYSSSGNYALYLRHVLSRQVKTPGPGVPAPGAELSDGTHNLAGWDRALLGLGSPPETLPRARY